MKLALILEKIEYKNFQNKKKFINKRILIIKAKKLFLNIEKSKKFFVIIKQNTY